jgi:WD40 repeat protein
VMARALAKRPEQRYASCREFTDTLRETFGLPPYGSGAVAAYPGAAARQPAGRAPGTTADLYRKHDSTQAAAVGQGARSGPGPADGEPARQPRRRPLVIAGAGAVLVAAVAIPWLLTSSHGATAAKTQAGTQARPSATLTAPAGSHAVESAAFKPGTATLAVGMFNGDVDLWNTTTKKIINILHDPGGGTDGVGLVAFGSGGNTLAVGDGGNVFLWDTATDKNTATLPTPVDVSGQSVTSVAFGPGGALAVGYSGGDVYLWNTATDKNTATLTGPPGLAGTDGVSSLAFGPGGTTMAVGYNSGDVYLWDIPSTQTMATIAAPAGSQANVSVAFGPGGTTVAVGYDSGDVYLRDTATEKVTDILHGPGGGAGGVSAVAFGPGGTLAAGAANGDVSLWPIKS